jgi:hypothetical protein
MMWDGFLLGIGFILAVYVVQSFGFLPTLLLLGLGSLVVAYPTYVAVFGGLVLTWLGKAIPWAILAMLVWVFVWMVCYAAVDFVRVCFLALGFCPPNAIERFVSGSYARPDDWTRQRLRDAQARARTDLLITLIATIPLAALSIIESKTPSEAVASAALSLAIGWGVVYLIRAFRTPIPPNQGDGPVIMPRRQLRESPMANSVPPDFLQDLEREIIRLENETRGHRE